MFCQKCGTAIPENDRYCPTCGEPVPGVKTPSVSDHTAMFAPEDIARSKVLSALCYFNFIFIIIALLLEPDSKFLRYHINQSIVLYIFTMIAALTAIVPFIGWITATVGSIMAIVFTVMGIIRAMNGEAKDLPIVGKYSVVKYD